MALRQPNTPLRFDAHTVRSDTLTLSPYFGGSSTVSNGEPSASLALAWLTLSRAPWQVRVASCFARPTVARDLGTQKVVLLQLHP